MAALTSGLMQAVTAAAGQALNDVGGLRITRLTQSVAIGDTTFHVERSLGLPSSGRIAVDGVPYRYQVCGDGELSGISYTHGGIPQAGAAAAHALGAQVTDLSGTYSAIDQANRALFVDTAEGADLSVIGRNLGVPRAPTLEDDAQYRALIKTLAYNPRGTLLGLRLVLDTLVGPGQFSILEDLIASPCQVFVTVPGALFLNNVSEGKSYLEDTLPVTPNGNTATSQAKAFFASSLRHIDENFLTTCSATLPDPALWPLTLVPPSFASNVSTQPAFVAGAGSATDLNQTPGYYHHAGSIAPQTYARLQCRVAIGTDKVLSATDGRQFGARLCDGTRAPAWGVMKATGTTASLGLIAAADGTFISGAAITLTLGSFYDIQLRKLGQATYGLYLNGALVQSAAYATASASGLYGADIGNFAGTATPHVQLLNLGFSCSTNIDYLNLQPAFGVTASLATGSAQLTFNQAVLQPSDTGKALRISQSASSNPSGGNNNGTYVVNYAGPQAATLTLSRGTAQVTNTNPQRITLALPKALTYPDNLGTSIQLSGSTQGNNGTYTIVRLIDPDLGTSFAAFGVTKPRQTNICEVSSASFVPEQNLTYALLPQFVAEQNVHFELVDVASHTTTANGLLALTPRAPDVLPAVPLAMRAANVQTAQVFDTHVPFITFNANGPSASPLYVSDPVFFISSYLQGVVAAGVRLNFQFS